MAHLAWLVYNQAIFQNMNVIFLEMQEGLGNILFWIKM